MTYLNLLFILGVAVVAVAAILFCVWTTGVLVDWIDSMSRLSMSLCEVVGFLALFLQILIFGGHIVWAASVLDTLWFP